MPVTPTQGTVSMERLKDAVRRFHKAGESGLTRDQLADQVGLSLRGADRILNKLMEDGAVIKITNAPGSRLKNYQMTKPPHWDRRISGDTRHALRLAGLALTASGTRQWDAILAILNKVAEEGMTDADHKVFQRLENSVRIHGEAGRPAEGREILEPLLRALEARSLTTLDYRAAGWDKSTPIQVVPYTLVHDLFAGSAFLVAWNPAKNQVQHLRLNRIAGLRIDGRGLLGPRILDLLEEAARFQVGGWTGNQTPFEVAVRIKGRYWVQALKDAQPALPDYRHEVSGDTLTAHFKATHSAGVLRWVLQFGPNAEVLAPPELREEMMKKLAAMGTLYPS